MESVGAEWVAKAREMENPILASIVYAGCVRLAFA